MIKSKLKDMGIVLGEFAETLGISRSTLDKYIKLYEQGKVIPKEDYDNIFHILFDEVLPYDEFLNILGEFEEEMMRVEMMDIKEFSPYERGLLLGNFDIMKKDMKDKRGFDNTVHEFAGFSISAYKDIEVLYHVTKLFSYMVGITDMKNVEENEKIFISNLYRLIQDFEKGELKVDEIAFKNLQKEIESNKQMIEDGRERMKEELLKQPEIKQMMDAGIDIDYIVDTIIANEEFED
ncbi:helix-turn-helix transcriptional regulator [Peptostreptococcaceae bacterium AGR-M142]